MDNIDPRLRPSRRVACTITRPDGCDTQAPQLRVVRYDKSARWFLEGDRGDRFTVHLSPGPIPGNGKMIIEQGETGRAPIMAGDAVLIAAARFMWDGVDMWYREPWVEPHYGQPGSRLFDSQVKAHRGDQ